MIDAALAGVDKHDTAAIQKAIEEYAVECSIVKVWDSRDARPRRRRGAADLRRLRLRRGVSGRARLPRRPHQPHLRGHQRDQPPHHHRLADEVGDVRQARPDARHQEADGRGDVWPQREGSIAKARSPTSTNSSPAPRSLRSSPPEPPRKSTWPNSPTSRRSWEPSPT